METYYIVYQITNKLNNKIYIGVHKTNNLDDGYMGSGTLLKIDQEILGLANFDKKILANCANSTIMYEIEAALVSEDFISRSDTYNMRQGGTGGFDHINSNTELRIAKNRKAAETTNSKYKDKKSEWGRLGGIAKLEKHGINEKWLLAGRTGFLGKQHSQETKDLIGKLNALAQLGDKNSQFNTMWITNGVESKKIKKDSDIPEGWYKGRKLKCG